MVVSIKVNLATIPMRMFTFALLASDLDELAHKKPIVRHITAATKKPAEIAHFAISV